jgi:hypothetical protein
MEPKTGGFYPGEGGVDGLEDSVGPHAAMVHTPHPYRSMMLCVIVRRIHHVA